MKEIDINMESGISDIEKEVFENHHKSHGAKWDSILIIHPITFTYALSCSMLKKGINQRVDMRDQVTTIQIGGSKLKVYKSFDIEEGKFILN